MESYQRTQALVLLDDMASRVAMNCGFAASYVTGSPLGAGAACPTAGSTATRQEIDAAEWCLALQGAAETNATLKVGAMIGGRGCIDALPDNEYLITVAWQGLTPIAAPPAGLRVPRISMTARPARPAPTIAAAAPLLHHRSHRHAGLMTMATRSPGRRATCAMRAPHGFTLVELMVAMTISLVLLAGLVSFFVNLSASHRELEKMNGLIENGRFAMQVFEDDLVHAGFWGGYVPQFDDLSSSAIPGDAPTGVPNPCRAYSGWDSAYRTNLLGIPVQTYETRPTGTGCSRSAHQTSGQ